MQSGTKSSQAAHAAAPQASPAGGREGVLQRKCACGKNTAGGGACGACDREKARLQRRAAGALREPSNVPDSVREVLGSAGSPLDARTRSFMESRFGHDFSRVKVHTDARAAESARAVNSSAYTVGRDIVFGAGQYAPESPAGRRLLAHELTHTIQQGAGQSGGGAVSLASKSELHVGPAGDALEAEADRIAGEITGASDVRVALRSSAGNIQRAIVGTGPGSPGGLESLMRGETNYVEDTELITCMQIMGEDSREDCLRQIRENPRPTGCVKGHPRTVSVQPVFFKSSDADPAPTGTSWAGRFAESNRIWGKLGVTFTELAPVTLVDAHKTQGANLAESQAITALHSGGGVEVFVVDNDITWRGGALTFLPLGPATKSIMSDRGTSTTLLAHELGHVLGLFHPGDGTPNDGAPRTIMQGTGSHSVDNPTRNTMDNYRRMTWPGDPQLVCINPDI